MGSLVNETDFVARAVVYNLLTVDIELPFRIGVFAFNEYPDEVAAQYHLGQGERPAEWDTRYPKWYTYLEYQLTDNSHDQYLKQFLVEQAARKLLSRLLQVLQLYSPTPLSGHVHAIRSASRADFTEEDVFLFPRAIGGNPTEAEVYFIAKDNLDAIKQHFTSLWDRDWHLINLPTSRYMRSYTRDIYSEEYEPDDAFMDLMIALDNLFGSAEAVGYKVALRAACLLETTSDKRGKLSEAIKDWWRKRNQIAHGKGERIVEWEDVEGLREVVRRAIMAVWRVQLKGDDLDDYLFLCGRSSRALARGKKREGPYV